MAAQTFTIMLNVPPAVNEPQVTVPYYDSGGSATVQSISALAHTAAADGTNGPMFVCPQVSGQVIRINANLIASITGPA